jgi:hypothetical protein
MSDLNGLREHGITTTKADYWVHFFPLALEAYWYRVEHLRTYIGLKQTPITFGHSKDGKVTGAGYLIPKNIYFVCRADVERDAIMGFNWLDMSDRQFGLAGQAIVAVLIDRCAIKFPARRATFEASAEAQLSSTDFTLQWLCPSSIEVKCERHSQSNNLFVQTHEGGHRVHLVRTDEELVRRVTEAPGFEREGGF